MRKLTGNWKLKRQRFNRFIVLVEVQLYPQGEYRRLAPHWVGYEMAKPGDLEQLNIKAV